MRNRLLILSALVCHVSGAQTSTLSKYQMTVIPGVALDFFAEPTAAPPAPIAGKPAPTAPAGGNPERARVFISPFLSAPLDAISIIGANGDWLKASELNAETAAGAKVNVKLMLSMPPYETDLSWKKGMIAVINNIPNPPALQINVAGKVIGLGGNIVMPTSPYAPLSTGVGLDPFFDVYQWYLNSYSF